MSALKSAVGVWAKAQKESNKKKITGITLRFKMVGLNVACV